MAESTPLKKKKRREKKRMFPVVSMDVTVVFLETAAAYIHLWMSELPLQVKAVNVRREVYFFFNTFFFSFLTQKNIISVFHLNIT